jgi:FdhE protein
MRGGILRRWLGKATANAVPPEVADAMADLDRASRERPGLEPSLQVFRAVLPALYENLPPVPVLAITAKEVRTKLAQGLPALRGERLQLDDPTHESRWRRLCELSGTNALATAEPARILALRNLIHEILAGTPEIITAKAEELGLDGGLIGTLLRLHWFPVLTQIQVALSPHLVGTPWERGYCPICGCVPVLAELRGLEQGRYLRCGLCAASWELIRLQCPFCASRDHRDLGYFQVAGEETRFRVATCDGCRRYLKTVSTLSELSGPCLLAADAATLHLDLAAADRGNIV